MPVEMRLVGVVFLGPSFALVERGELALWIDAAVIHVRARRRFGRNSLPRRFATVL